MLNAELLMFRWISWRPVVVEGHNYHHSSRLDEAVLMSCVTSFYDHWMLRYSTKRIFLIFNFEIWTRTVRSDQFWFDWIWTDLILIRFKLIWTDLIGSKFFWTESKLQIRYIWSDLDLTDQIQISSNQISFF